MMKHSGERDVEVCRIGVVMSWWEFGGRRTLLCLCAEGWVEVEGDLVEDICFYLCF